MFVAAGPTADRFCAGVERLGEQARTLSNTEKLELIGGLALFHLDAAELLAEASGERLRAFVDSARRSGALISIDLGPTGWIEAHGSSRTAYQLATLRPDILFAGQASAAELAAPLEGIAAVPVLLLASGGCSVYGRRLVVPTESHVDEVALMAAFCVAYVEGAAPVEAAGRAVLVAARSLA